jgi:hypothetical protein
MTPGERALQEAAKEALTALEVLRGKGLVKPRSLPKSRAEQNKYFKGEGGPALMRLRLAVHGRAKPGKPLWGIALSPTSSTEQAKTIEEATSESVHEE